MAEINSLPLKTDPNLTSYYRFESNSNDAAGGINGTDTNVSYALTYGQFGQGAYFNGAAYINLGNHNNLNHDFSISCWIKVSSSSNRQTIISKGTGSHYQWEFIVDGSTNFIRLRLYQAGGSDYLVCSGVTTVNDNKWHLVTATYNYTTHQAYVYVDGNQDGSTSSTSGTYDSSDSASCWIGGRATSSNYWNGNLDDLAIFGRALSNAEVLSIYVAGASGAGILFNLASNWKNN